MVQERQVKVFGCRIIHVADKSIGVHGFHGLVQALEVMFDSFASEPSNERSCDLVTERVAKQRRVSGANTRFVLD